MEQEVVGVEALEEEVVEHVLGGEMEGDGTSVGLEELLKFGSQELGGVGEVFLDVGGEDDLLDAEGFVGLEDLEGLLEGWDTVVDSGEDVGVVVGEVVEDALLGECFFLVK